MDRVDHPFLLCFFSLCRQWQEIPTSGCRAQVHVPSRAFAIMAGVGIVALSSDSIKKRDRTMQGLEDANAVCCSLYSVLAHLHRQRRKGGGKR